MFGHNGRSRSTGNLFHSIQLKKDAPSLLKTDRSQYWMQVMDQQTELRLQLKQCQDENRRLRNQVQRMQQQNQRNRSSGMSWAQMTKIEQLLQQQNDQIVDMQRENVALKKQNQKLKDNLLLVKIKASGSMPGTQATIVSDPYEHVQARVDTGLRSAGSRSMASGRAAISSKGRTLHRDRPANGSTSNEINAIVPRVSFSRQLHLDSSSDSEDGNQLDSRQRANGKLNKESINGNDIESNGISRQLLNEARNEIAKLEQIVLMQQNFIEKSMSRSTAKPIEPDDASFERLKNVDSDDFNEFADTDDVATINGYKNDETELKESNDWIGERDLKAKVIAEDSSHRKECETPAGSLALSSPKPEVTLELASHVDHLRLELREQRKESAQLRLRLMQKDLADSGTEGLTRQLDQFKAENRILRESLEQFSAQCIQSSALKHSASKNMSNRIEEQMKRFLDVLEDDPSLSGK